MKDGTAEEYRFLERLEEQFNAGLVDRLMQALQNLEHGLSGYQVSRLEHSLQTAARAEADGGDDDLVVGALLHDLGDELAPCNHSQLAASIIRPYVSAEVTWIVHHHGLFQKVYYAQHFGEDPNERERYRDHPGTRNVSISASATIRRPSTRAIRRRHWGISNPCCAEYFHAHPSTSEVIGEEPAGGFDSRG